MLTSSTLVVTPRQRDALLYVADDAASHTLDDEGWGAERLPIVTAVIDDLVLPDADGLYRLCLPREMAIDFLTHELRLVLEGGLCPTGRWLPVWHACVDLLADLGHEPEGDIYEGIACCCGYCKRQAEEYRRKLAEFEEGE